jgi:hypothetical protein
MRPRDSLAAASDEAVAAIDVHRPWRTRLDRRSLHSNRPPRSDRRDGWAPWAHATAETSGSSKCRCSTRATFHAGAAAWDGVEKRIDA